MKKFLLWLASFRLRILFRSAFLLLALSVVALAVTVLQEEKQRSYKNYQTSLSKTKEQIAARLRHPSGQLALLNPPRGLKGIQGEGGTLHPVLLPFSAIDFDDQNKARHAVEMADCLIQYKRHGSLCVAIGNNPWIGGFIYAAGTFASGTLTPHEIGDKFLDGAHRMRATVSLRGETYRWLAPFEALPARRSAEMEGLRGRFTGYVELNDRDYTGEMPVKDFRGWIWQSAQCLEMEKNAERTGAAPEPKPAREGSEDCAKKSFFSLRLPVDILIAELLRTRKAPWPPPDLADIHVHIEVLPPGDGPALFDSEEAGAVAPFSLDDLGALLMPGEILTIRKEGTERELARIRGKDEIEEQTSPLLARLIRRLPVESYDAPVDLVDTVATPTGNYSVLLHGDAGSVVDKTLSATATRVSWFVIAMLVAISLAWLVIEIGIVRRIALLTRRSRQLSKSVRGTDGLLSSDISNLGDLRGNDELGILANCLNDLLRRVKEDAGREKIRAEQEKDQWHAVGHEIMSPLQSLLALHGSSDDPSYRYIARMQQAVRVLYGHASPSEAFQSSTLAVATLDIDAFLENVAANATHIGIENVVYDPAPAPVWVYADEYSLEDVVSHLLKNADRYRRAGTPITLKLEMDEKTDAAPLTVVVHNVGLRLSPEWMERIFEYGVSDPQEASARGNRGQGLFVAKTYMAKMGGTIGVRNESDGVSFLLGLQRAGRDGMRGGKTGKS